MKHDDRRILFVSTDMHHKAKIAAAQAGITMQKWIENLIEKEVNK